MQIIVTQIADLGIYCIFATNEKCKVSHFIGVFVLLNPF